MECRNSPVAKTPPSHLPDIPGVTSPSLEELKLENHHVQSCGEEKVSTGKCQGSKTPSSSLGWRFWEFQGWRAPGAVVGSPVISWKARVGSVSLGNEVPAVV